MALIKNLLTFNEFKVLEDSGFERPKHDFSIRSSDKPDLLERYKGRHFIFNLLRIFILIGFCAAVIFGGLFIMMLEATPYLKYLFLGLGIAYTPILVSRLGKTQVKIDKNFIVSVNGARIKDNQVFKKGKDLNLVKSNNEALLSKSITSIALFGFFAVVLYLIVGA